MKITDISSCPSSGQPQEEEVVSVSTTKRKVSLLQKYQIPIEQLDFDYVKKCNDGQKVERILRILRSGEEGSFPDLENLVQKRLEELNPKSKVLRVEKPALRSNELDKEEVDQLKQGLNEWITGLNSVEDRIETNAIFDEYNKCVPGPENCPIPVRGSGSKSANGSNGGSKPKKSGERIKSWEYDKWDKFDVEKELMKMDICEMQQQEWEKREKPRLVEEQMKVERLMKSSETDGSGDAKVNPSAARKTTKETQGKGVGKRDNFNRASERSYIEEIDDDDEDEGTQVNVAKSAPCLMNRNSGKTKIVLEDLNLRM